MLTGTAKVVKRITDDGLVELEDDVPLGREYQVDLASRRIVLGYNFVKKKQWRREIINVVDGPKTGWYPTELLEMIPGGGEQ